MEPSDSAALAGKTGRVSFKANKFYNYRLKLLLSIKRCSLLSTLWWKQCKQRLLDKKTKKNQIKKKQLTVVC